VWSIAGRLDVGGGDERADVRDGAHGGRYEPRQTEQRADEYEHRQHQQVEVIAVTLLHGTTTQTVWPGGVIGDESVPIQLARCWFPGNLFPVPFPMLKYKYIFQIKYTEAILSNSTRQLLWFEISKMLIAV